MLTEEKRDRLVDFIRKEFNSEFEPSIELLTVLDSVAFLKIVMFIESEFRVMLDMSHMGAENFRTVDTLLEMIESA